MVCDASCRAFDADAIVTDDIFVADEIALMQGVVDDRRFIAAYGRGGRTVAALAVNMPRRLDVYKALIQARAPFPAELPDL